MTDLLSSKDRAVDNAPVSKKKPSKSRKDFEFINILGEGTLSKVYHGRNVTTKEEVAIKVIPKKIVSSNQVLQCILNERNILSSLEKHPNTVKLYSAFQDQMYLYYVLEIIRGGTLSDTLKRYRTHISDEIRLYWIYDLLNLLIFLRSHKIAHRDFKADNILIDDRKILRLIDFNSAIFINEDQNSDEESKLKDDNNISSPPKNSNSLTDPADEDLFGGLCYLPPEILIKHVNKLFSYDSDIIHLVNKWKKESPCDYHRLKVYTNPYAIDLWAVGCLIYEITVGRSPFHGYNDLNTICNILYNKIEYPSSLCEDYIHLIKSLLMYFPDDRKGLLCVTDLFDCIPEKIAHKNYNDIYDNRPPILSLEMPDTSFEDVFDFTPDLSKTHMHSFNS